MVPSATFACLCLALIDLHKRCWKVGKPFALVRDFRGKTEIDKRMRKESGHGRGQSYLTIGS